jgi:hypothetical protein
MEWLRIIRGSEGLDLTRIQRLSAAEETLADPEVLQNKLVLATVHAGRHGLLRICLLDRSFRSRAFTSQPRSILAGRHYASDVNLDRLQAEMAREPRGSSWQFKKPQTPGARTHDEIRTLGNRDGCHFRASRQYGPPGR